MKAILIIFMNILWVALSSFNTSIAGDVKENEYVYVMAVNGENVFRITNQASGNKEKIRIKECIYSGAVIEIGKDATITLACSNSGKIVVKTHKDSPYTVNMKEFEWDRSVVKTLIEAVKKAIGEAILPDETGEQKILATRKPGLCNRLWPPDEAKILTTKEPITFQWKLNGSKFSLEIKDDKGNTIYSKEILSNSINVPIEVFKPNRKYTWILKKEGKECEASFELLSIEDSAKITKILDDISSHLPAEVDKEPRCRLLAAYLCSEELIYDAYQLLKRNGIKQEYAEKEDK